LVAAFLVTRVVDDGRNLDALCDHSHGLSRYLKLEERDRGLVRGIAITALRHRNQIESILARVMDRRPPKNARFLLQVLHVAVAQIVFMDVPDSAAVNLAVTAIKNDQRTTRFASLANAVLRRIVSENEVLREQTAAQSCLPAWMYKKLRSDYGKENVARISQMVTDPARVDITVKADPQDWAEKLDGIVLPTGSIRLRSTTSIQELYGYQDGVWWVQDAAAALPARLIKADKSMRVLELCAAPGGKTAQLAAAGYDTTALDVSASRLKRLEENLKRLRFSADVIEADILEWSPSERFDAVLIDAPCSSTGTIRRHPDVLWARREPEIAELADLQLRLVERAADFVKPGGSLVFSNCSLFKQEGENLIGKILERAPQLTLDPIDANEVPGIAEMINGQGALRSMPYHLQQAEGLSFSGLDGFFACRFRVS